MHRITFFLALVCATATALPSWAQSTPERPIEAAGPLGPLRGALLQASAPRAPVALILPGSGPTDRDGNGPAGLRTQAYKLLAEGLAGHGISAARVDKRGMFGSAQAVADANQVTLQDYAADVRAWVRMLQQETGARCAWIVGHSEGALVALLAGSDDPAICGAILLAAPGRPLGQLLRDQLAANPANKPFLEPAFAALRALESGHRVDATALPAPLLPLFHPRVQDFLVAALAVDPARAAAAYRKPLLVVQGERDLQVSVDDARVLARAAPHARLLLVPGMNHVLKQVDGDDRAANVARYADPSLPLAAGVVAAIAAFIAAFVAEHGRN